MLGGLDTLAHTAEALENESESEEEEVEYSNAGTASKKRKVVASPKKKKKRGGSRINKGLRHFSIKVCEKLSQTGVTTHNEIANLLVNESRPTDPDEEAGYDEKNIRRRIYDALNVLMAMDIIEKDKKEIRWKGIHFAPESDYKQLKEMKDEITNRIKIKKQLLEEMTFQFIALRNLFEQNQKRERSGQNKNKAKLQLPFVVVNTAKSTDINCEMTDDRKLVVFNYSDKFSINDDNVVLKQIGMQERNELVPNELKPFLPSRFPNASLPAAAKSLKVESLMASFAKSSATDPSRGGRSSSSSSCSSTPAAADLPPPSIQILQPHSALLNPTPESSVDSALPNPAETAQSAQQAVQTPSIQTQAQMEKQITDTLLAGQRDGTLLDAATLEQCITKLLADQGVPLASAAAAAHAAAASVTATTNATTANTAEGQPAATAGTTTAKVAAPENGETKEAAAAEGGAAGSSAAKIASQDTASPSLSPALPASQTCMDVPSMTTPAVGFSSSLVSS